MRSYAWENTSLGSPEQWPLSLRTTVGIVLHSSFPMFLFWGKDLLCFYNDAYRPSLGIDGKHPLIGKKAQEAWPEIWDFIHPIIQKVISSGEASWFEDQLLPIYRNGRMEDVYWTFSYSPAYDDSGEISGVFVTCTETTSKVNALESLKESKDQLEFAVDAAELGAWELNPFTNKFRGNDRLKAWFGLSPEKEIDLTLATNVIAEKDREKVKAAIEKALTFESGGLYDIDYTIQNPLTLKETIVKAKGKALFNSQKQAYRFSGTLQDVTQETMIRQQLAQEIAEQKTAKAQFEESELFSRDVIYNSPVAKIVYTGPEMKIKIVNENMLQILGRDNTILGKSFTEAIPELKGTSLEKRMLHVFNTGETYQQSEEQIALVRFGEPYTGFYNYTYKALRLVSGEIYGLMATATEVTDQVVARKKIEAKEKELRDLISAAPIGICVVSGYPDTVRAVEVNDRFLVISGKSRTEFMSNPYWDVLHEIAPMFDDVLKNVFETAIRFTSEEHEMTLIRDGVEEKIFATFEYVPVFDINQQVEKVIIIAIEVTHQVLTRKKIEEAVRERTKELGELNYSLKRSNAELEQFAYIASHDLQEPVRKISTFTQMLEDSMGEVSEQSQKYISKIYASTDRMAKLIRDVLAFSQVTQNTAGFEAVDLSKIMKTVESDFELLIEQTGATVEIGAMPVISAIPSQMIQLFDNLMSNSLKYTQPGVKPIIRITASIAKKEKLDKHPYLPLNRKYHHIAFSDNGIGFDQEHADRIFKIFQRLHGKAEFEGTGIGLSICRKIVQSHQGHISAAVGENGGAVFNILLAE